MFIGAFGVHVCSLKGAPRVAASHRHIPAVPSEIAVAYPPPPRGFEIGHNDTCEVASPDSSRSNGLGFRAVPCMLLLLLLLLRMTAGRVTCKQ
jgi:hypothetical protein